MPIFVQYGAVPALGLAANFGDQRRFEDQQRISNDLREIEARERLGWQSLNDQRTENDRNFDLKKYLGLADVDQTQQRIDQGTANDQARLGIDQRQLDLQQAGGYYDRNEADPYKAAGLALRERALNQSDTRLNQQLQSAGFSMDYRTAQGNRQRAVQAIQALDANATTKEKQDPNSTYNRQRSSLVDQLLKVEYPDAQQLSQPPTIPAQQQFGPTMQSSAAGSGSVAVPVVPQSTGGSGAWVGRPGTYNPGAATTAEGAQGANQSVNQSALAGQDGNVKVLTKDVARMFLQQAGGNRQQAEAMARAAGYTF
jgi:hypothetical protein